MNIQLRSKRGSALLIASIVSMVLMLLVTSYLNLVSTTAKTSNQSYHGTAALNLAENGLEEALYEINEARAGRTAFGGNWNKSGTVATRTFSNDFSVGQTSTGNSVTVQVTNYTLATAPTIKARAVVNLPDGNIAEKWVELKLESVPYSVPASTAPAFPGLVAKYQIKFNGNNPTVDSWNSDPDGDPATAAVAFDSTAKNDKGFVGSLDVRVDQLTVQNADIFGYVSTYADTNINNNVGPNGSILAKDSPTGTRIDNRRVSTDFVATLPDVVAPSVTPITIPAITGSTNLPRAGDAAVGGKYYYNVPGISMSGNSSNKVNITSSDVILIVPSPYNVSFGGQSSLNIASGASLQLFAGGNVDIGGNGVANGSLTDSITTTNAQQPIKFQVWGTAAANGASAGQTISIKGNGALSGVVYAPNGSVTIVGNGDILGSVVGNDITLTGNAMFHYDESLGTPDWNKNSDSGSTPLKVAQWRELTGSYRTF